MSAYVVDKAHINAMVQFGLLHIHHYHGPMVWYHNGESHYLTRETEDAVGQMLLDECVRSVCYRYEDCSITDLPGRTDAEYLLPFQAYPIYNVPSPVEALKLIACYDYQSCEHPEWPQSESYQFCDSLRDLAVNQLPGYDDAPWSWTPQHDNAKVKVS